MSQENVEVVRLAIEALNRALASNDLTSVLHDFLDPDIDWRAVEGAIDDVGGMRGHDAVRRYIQDWTEVFDNLSLTPQEFIDVDDERVLVTQRFRGRSRHTGIASELTFQTVYTIRAGQIVKVREYETRAEAAEAVGLSE